MKFQEESQALETVIKKKKINWKENVQRRLIMFQSLMREDFLHPILKLYHKAAIIKARCGFAAETDQWERARLEGIPSVYGKFTSDPNGILIEWVGVRGLR